MSTPLKPRKEQAAKIYTSLRILNTYTYPIIESLQKDIRSTVGHRIINSTLDALLNFKNAYETERLEEKLKNIEVFRNDVDNIDLLCRMLSELKYISIKQTATIIRYVADIMIQVDAWKTTTENKIKPEIN